MDEYEIAELMTDFDIHDGDELKHRLEDWERWRKEIVQLSIIAESKAAPAPQGALIEERDRLAEALRTYGRHKPDCAAHKCRVCGKSSEWMTHPPSFADSVHRFEPADCTCGFSALLSSLESAQ